MGRDIGEGSGRGGGGETEKGTGKEGGRRGGKKRGKGEIRRSVAVFLIDQFRRGSCVEREEKLASTCKTTPPPTSLQKV